MNRYIAFIVAGLFFVGCAYKFNGASIPPGMKTVNVIFFENVAPLVEPSLSQQFTEELKMRIRNQSRLSLTTSPTADAIFEGKITGYEIKPVAIQDNMRPVAAASRLTITVSVKYVNNADSTGKSNFEESFNAFTDFSSSSSFEGQKQSLINKVNMQLTENIFNRAFSQW